MCLCHEIWHDANESEEGGLLKQAGESVLQSRSIFVRLLLQLVKNYGSGFSLSKVLAPAPTIFPLNFLLNSKIFMVKKMLCF
jgi:hypothetical protein